MNEDPAVVTKPVLFFRLFLAFLNRRTGLGVVPDPHSVPQVPGARPSPETLARIRQVTGQPSFVQSLSGLRVRRWRSIKVTGADGVLSARLYRPRGRVKGLVLFMHGGGFVHCDTRSHHGICCRLSAASGAMIVAPDYRLAPEHPFPAGLEDGWAVLQWMQRCNPGLPIAVAGDSAGGTFAAALAQRMRDEGGGLAAQLLYYPALSGPVWVPSRSTYAEGYMLTTKLLEWYCGQALEHPQDLYDPRFAPALATRFDGLAPAMIVTAGFDPLRDEGRGYAVLLRRAGVTVRYRDFPRMIHGFLNFYVFVRDGRRALREGGRFLRNVFTSDFSQG